MARKNSRVGRNRKLLLLLQKNKCKSLGGQEFIIAQFPNYILELISSKIKEYGHLLYLLHKLHDILDSNIYRNIEPCGFLSVRVAWCLFSCVLTLKNFLHVSQAFHPCLLPNARLTASTREWAIMWPLP